MVDTNSDEDIMAAKYAKELLSCFGEFLKSSGLKESMYECDTFTLMATTKRYLNDVERLHKHHGIKHIDCYKIAGYLSHWICKMKPFRATSLKNAYASTPEGLAKKTFFTNELFSIHMGLARINAHYRHKKLDKRVVLCAKHYEAMSYSLKYRHTTGDMLTLFFEMVDKASSGAVEAEVDLLHIFRQIPEVDKKRAIGVVRGFIDTNK